MSASMSTLRRQFKGRCHYCDNMTNGTPRSSRQATKDHVFPKALGGPNSHYNYVLACAGCNHKRGTQMFYCTCELCLTIINHYLDNPDVLNQAFNRLIAANKPHVSRRRDGQWQVKRGTVVRTFGSWGQAVGYGLHGSFKKGE